MCLFGSQQKIFVRLGTKDIRTFSQVFGGLEYDSFDFSEAPKVIIDGGGNIGLAAIFFARKFPTATIYTIEPSEENYSILLKNTAPYGNIIPIHAALWQQTGTIDLFDPGAGSWGFATGESDTVTEHPVIEKVRATTIPELIRIHGLSCIDLLKLDIEGSEKEVLADSDAWIKSVKMMIVELHEESRKGCEEAWNKAITEFPDRWISGENDCAARSGCRV
jgi:FkbM family methyltransferase